MEKTEINHPIEILIIGGSAGSFDVLMEVIPKIKSDITFPIVIVLHRKQSAHSSIIEVFKHRTKLKVHECEDKDELKPSVIYFAPPDYHLLLEKEQIFALDYSEKVHYSRPSIDIAFKSIADIFGDKTAAILLSGANADGAEGLAYIHQKNGTTIVQDPTSAEVNVMPKQALKLFEPTYIANASQIVEIINNF